MDNTTKAYALEKAAIMISHIAYPDELLNISKLDEFYEKVEINTDDYLGSYLNLTSFQVNVLSSRLREPLNKIEWKSHGESVTTVHEFYFFNGNSISIYNNKFRSDISIIIVIINNNIHRL